RRPSMYIGSTSTTGLQHLVYEVVDNAVDEALAGYAHKIVVTLFADGSVQVDDDGRGIPVDVHKKEGLSALELVMTRLNAGGKFGGGGYKVSSGLHGVGVSAVNFLSQKLEVWVHLGGKVYHQAYERGVPKAAVKAIGKTDRKGTIVGGRHLTGFRPALTNVLNRYARKAGILKESDPNLTGEDVREGLTAVISVKVLEPQFEGQTKGKLGNAEVQGHVSLALSEGL